MTTIAEQTETLTLVVVSIEDTGTEHSTIAMSSVVHRLGIGEVVDVVQLGTLCLVEPGIEYSLD